MKFVSYPDYLKRKTVEMSCKAIVAKKYGSQSKQQELSNIDLILGVEPKAHSAMIEAANEWR